MGTGLQPPVCEPVCDHPFIVMYRINREWINLIYGGYNVRQASNLKVHVQSKIKRNVD